MAFWNKIFGKKDESARVGGMEDFMTLIRVYFQAALAAELGISNLSVLPDLRVFKTTLKVPTVNNKLGVGERSRCKNMLKSMYGMEDDFFKEIDQSLRRRCKKMQDAQPYLLQFQGFTQDIMMLTGNLMKFKLRLPGFMKKALYTMTEKTVNDIFNKNDFKEPDVLKTVVNIRQYNQRLGFSQKWVTDFVYKVVMLAKKEPRQSADDK
ncbi:MAG: hypothetical protein K5764_08055 [Prevotella sp.]|nr:hypothetical protein [Prevotella sp.]